MSFIFALGIIFLAGVGALGYIAYIKHIRKKAQEKVERLEIERDTIKIVEEYKRAKVAESWQEFDQQQWQIRYEAEQKRLAEEQ